MKSKRIGIVLTAVFLVSFTFASCGRNDTSTNAWDGVIVDVGHLEGEINVLALCVWGLYRDWRDIYAYMFTELHPGVVINFEMAPLPIDITQRVALTTRLIADPPDILIFDSNRLAFEKMNVEAVFANLYNFIDSPRGIDRDDYFCNIFTAAEIAGGLYHMPVYVNLNFAVLNNRLFEGIGVDTAEITSLTIDEEIDYFLRITEAFPSEELFAYENFSIMHVLERIKLYNLETFDVFVDTPEMHDLFERALQVPINQEFVDFKPHQFVYTVRNTLPNEFILTSGDMLIRIFTVAGLSESFIMFMGEHPDMQFSARPVLIATGNERDIGFISNHSFAIMRNTGNADLAWEFLRFIIETEDDFVYEWVFDDELNEYVVYGFRWHRRGNSYLHQSWLPINRTRFENQVGAVVTAHHRFALLQGGREHLAISETEHRRRYVPVAMDFLRNAMESITYEIRIDQAVMNSLIYPDIWLLYSGQQDIAATLSRIQSRLELYVHE